MAVDSLREVSVPCASGVCCVWWVRPVQCETLFIGLAGILMIIQMT